MLAYDSAKIRSVEIQTGLVLAGSMWDGHVGIPVFTQPGHQDRAEEIIGFRDLSGQPSHRLRATPIEPQVVEQETAPKPKLLPAESVKSPRTQVKPRKQRTTRPAASETASASVVGQPRPYRDELWDD